MIRPTPYSKRYETIFIHHPQRARSHTSKVWIYFASRLCFAASTFVKQKWKNHSLPLFFHDLRQQPDDKSTYSSEWYELHDDDDFFPASCVRANQRRMLLRGNHTLFVICYWYWNSECKPLYSRWHTREWSSLVDQVSDQQLLNFARNDKKCLQTNLLKNCWYLLVMSL